MSWVVRALWAVFVVLVGVFGATDARAHTSGIVSWDAGVSSPIQCTQCHAQTGAAPLSVSLKGPTSGSAITVGPSQLVTFTISVTPAASDTRRAAGLNVRVADPSNLGDHMLAVPGAESSLLRAASNGSWTEITQSTPLSVTPNGTSWTVNWTSPATCGETRHVTAWVNLVNGNGLPSGDYPSSAGLDVTVSCLTAAGATCSTSGQCQSGACFGGVCCAAACSNPPRACYSPAFCSAGTGACVPQSPSPSGSGCDDSNPLTSGDQCNGAGTCVPGTQTVPVLSWGQTYPGDGTLVATHLTPVPPSGALAPFKKVALGGSFTFGLDVNGRLWSWGNNSVGQLANWDVAAHRSPIRVQGIPLIVDVALGAQQGAAVDTSGDVLVWAYESSPPAPGMGDQSDTLPVSLSALGSPMPRSAVSVAAGTWHTLALTQDGNVWTWNNTVNTNPVVTQVPSLYSAIAIAAGNGFSLALRDNGTVWSWGRNDLGQLGRTTTSGAPDQIPGLTGVIAIAASGNHALALTSNGYVFGWGDDSSGQTSGTASPYPVRTPQQILSTFGVTAIAAGEKHSLGLSVYGMVYGWGDNSLGQLGTGDRSSSDYVRYAASNIGNVYQIAANGYQSALIPATFHVQTWGRNFDAQLGDGTKTSSAFAHVVSGVSGVKAVAAGCKTSYALLANGSLWAWGYNGDQEAGTGGGTWQLLPAQVQGLPALRSIGAGCWEGIGVDSYGNVWTWGNNADGQLGNSSVAIGADSTTPVAAAIPYYARARMVSGGRDHMLVLLDNGVAEGFGSNALGQLGNVGNGGNVGVLATGDTFKTVAAGEYFSAGLAANGMVITWGSNGVGQLGVCGASSGSRTTRNLTVAMFGDSARAISAGVYGVEVVGGYSASPILWGANSYGALGPSAGLAGSHCGQAQSFYGDYVQVYGGWNFNEYLVADGTIIGSGYNPNGELGNGGTASSKNLTTVVGVSNAVAIGVGRYHTLAIVP